MASKCRSPSRARAALNDTFTEDQGYGLRDQRVENEVRKRRRMEAGSIISAIGRVFALQESRNQLRGLKEKGPYTKDVTSCWASL